MGLIRIHPRCTHFIKELAGWHYPDKAVGDRDIKEEPVKKDDHGLDGVTYLTEYLFRDSFTIGGRDSIRLSGQKRKSARILKGHDKIYGRR